MSETVKLIIEIPRNEYEYTCERTLSDRTFWDDAIRNGIPLANDSEKAEVQAYFDGQAYGWEEGRKALIDDIKAKIDTDLSGDMFDEYGNETRLHKELMEILDNIGKAESEVTE